MSLSRTRKRQRLHKRAVVIKLSCASPCAAVTARGRLSVTRRSRNRVFRLKPVKRRVRDGRVTLRLKISPRARRAARRALASGGRVHLKVKVTARSATGAKLATAKQTIVLRR